MTVKTVSSFNVSLDRPIVIKIGSSSLTNSEGAAADRSLSHEKVADSVRAVAQLWKQHLPTILVSSGAVAAGATALKLKGRPQTVELRQAAAAVGQGLLMQLYADLFAKEGLVVAQVLLSQSDFSRRESYNNALATLTTLLEYGVVPIVNENDTVAVRTASFGDNDMLATLLSALVRAGLLVILTDTDGLYSADPKRDPNAVRISRVEQVTPELLALCGASGSKVGTGGMLSKVKAAERALSLGVPVYIGRAGLSDTVTNQDNGSLTTIVEGKGMGTYFLGDTSDSMSRKRQWIAFHSPVGGRITIDLGAEKALTKGGKSLLPAGVTHVVGHFQEGEVIEVFSSENILLGKGVTNYRAEILQKAMGLSTEYARTQLSIVRGDVIHRDNWISS